jgi:tetratricopeptide (TPR) repeat protein
MVKDEERITPRCLRAVLPHVDGVVLCSNGTDATVTIARAMVIERFADEKFLHVERQPWKNFGHNRTLSARTAKRWVREQHPEWPLDRTYLLFLDADMELAVRGDFRAAMTAPGYRVVQYTRGEDYQNLRFARLSHDWTSVGVTHEYWAPSPDFGEPTTLPSSLVHIVDHDDGGSKSDKTERDIALLEEGLKAEPDNYRYVFYLARAYADSGHHDRAIEFFRKRQAAGGWEEEAWYANYREGLELFAVGRETEAIGTLVKAYQRNTARAEPLVALAKHFRERGQNHAALLFARQARRIPYPDNPGLFVQADAHRHVPLDEIAVCAHYTGDQKEGQIAAEEILSRRDTNRRRGQVLVSFYVVPLAPHATRSGMFDVPEELRRAPGPFFGGPDPNTTEYLPSNPTIVRHDGRVFVNVRLVNYYHERGRVFSPKDADGIVRTRNVIQEWDPGKGEYVGAPRESIATLPPEWDHGTRVRGLEDQRWASDGRDVWLTFTCFNIPGAGGMPRVAIGRLDKTVGGIEAAHALAYAGSGRYEKNWLPWVVSGHLRLVYGYDPFTVLSPDKNGVCSIVSVSTPEFATDLWRGSAGPVSIPAKPGHWLLLIHEVAWHEGPNVHDQRSVYMHRFVEINQTEITRRSALFTFDHTGVEYAAGLLGHKDRFIVTHSVEESSARWKEFTWEFIDRLLEGELP